MGTFAAGQIVLVHFPFSDLTASKLRPAVILADAGRGDWISCQITSNAYGDRRAIAVAEKDFARGSLQRKSFVRPGKLFTAHKSLIAGEVGALVAGTLESIRDAIVQMVRSG
ncbi:MAG TPA: type II toxin-antitoxin system PemK/MazF family toxin [Lacipirellulaceae bacterium]